MAIPSSPSVRRDPREINALSQERRKKDSYCFPIIKKRRFEAFTIRCFALGGRERSEASPPLPLRKKESPILLALRTARGSVDAEGGRRNPKGQRPTGGAKKSGFLMSILSKGGGKGREIPPMLGVHSLGLILFLSQEEGI